MSAVATHPETPAPAGRMSREVLRELSRPRTPVDRLRAGATTAAATGIGVALLMAAAIAAVRSTEPTGSTLHYTLPDGTKVQEEILQAPGGLISFVADTGLRSGTTLAAVLLVLPFVALALQAARVGSLALEREAALLTLAGAAPADLRRVRVRRTASAFALGGMLAGPAYLVAWLVLGLAPPYGSRLLPAPEPWLGLAWLGVVLALAAAGAVLGTWSSARRGSGPLAARARAEAPSRLHVVLPVVAAIGLFPVFAVPGLSGVLSFALLLAELLLLLWAAGAASARRAARGTSTRPRRTRPLRVGFLHPRDPAAAVLAAAQRAGNPRAVAAAAGVLFLCGFSFGVEAAFLAFFGTEPVDSHDVAFYVTGVALAAAVAAVAILVALAALALSLTDHLLGARRAVASTDALGADTTRLVAVQARALTATALPAMTAGIVLGGLLYGTLTLGATVDALRWLPASILLVAALNAAAVVLACRVLARALAGRVRAAAALENLRTP
ncbi:hypothetical protein CLV92_108187 [Kineococcus xinjiangensis]|uniref:FtsX-like permease family protein n=1 Tax=Kineococcus xinjiangensis TaxID=512762 RepID=A0A2S6IJ81_9ACTN|nr:hypothetical protein [Kineococcus xinjiangensis]PPK94284.1 hypothetical protein CLV92_108187 [Kineococcus xinjiangensis]